MYSDLYKSRGPVCWKCWGASSHLFQSAMRQKWNVSLKPQPYLDSLKSERFLRGLLLRLFSLSSSGASAFRGNNVTWWSWSNTKKFFSLRGMIWSQNSHYLPTKALYRLIFIGKYFISRRIHFALALTSTTSGLTAAGLTSSLGGSLTAGIPR